MASICEDSKNTLEFVAPRAYLSKVGTTLLTEYNKMPYLRHFIVFTSREARPALHIDKIFVLNRMRKVLIEHDAI